MKQMVATEQIENIRSDEELVSAVNSAIERGEISVGSNIYLHILTIRYCGVDDANRNRGTITFNLFNNSETPITSEAQIKEAIRGKKFPCSGFFLTRGYPTPNNRIFHCIFIDYTNINNNYFNLIGFATGIGTNSEMALNNIEIDSNNITGSTIYATDQVIKL